MQLLAATRNNHKLAELRAILGAAYEVIGLDDLPDAPDVVEDATTFADNAIKKAVRAAQLVRGDMLAFADDSGLEVDALDGAPGVISARYAQEPSGPRPDARMNNEKLLRELASVPDEKRTAAFRCVIAMAGLSFSLAAAAHKAGLAVTVREPYTVVMCQGFCHGCILRAPRGEHGFGYDPLFVPEGQDKTFAELGDDVKNVISHRARALAKIKTLLEGMNSKV